jgi:hypothetical protein
MHAPPLGQTQLTCGRSKQARMHGCSGEGNGGRRHLGALRPAPALVLTMVMAAICRCQAGCGLPLELSGPDASAHSI